MKFSWLSGSHIIFLQHYENILYYYTSDSLWKILLVKSVQLIYNSLWPWHDKYNICCRYCIYHVKFKVCLVTKPLEVLSSETEWLNASPLFLRMRMYNKTIIEFGFRMISWITKNSCLYYLPKPNTDLGFDNSWYLAQPHPIIVYYESL